MDKPSGTRALCAELSFIWSSFNFPGWINHPEQRPTKGVAIPTQFQLPRMDKPSGTGGYFNCDCQEDAEFQLPRMDKPSGTLAANTRARRARSSFQLPRMDKPSGTPAELQAITWLTQFQLPRMDKPSGTAALKRPRAAVGLRASSAQPHYGLWLAFVSCHEIH